MTFDNLPFVLRLVWDPVRALDLVDSRADGPDHSKVLPAAVMACVIVFKAIGHAFGVWEIIALLSAAYGYGAWRTFLASRSVTGTVNETSVSTIATEVKVAAREVSGDFDGVQATSG